MRQAGILVSEDMFEEKMGQRKKMKIRYHYGILRSIWSLIYLMAASVH